MKGYITHKTVKERPDGSHDFRLDLTRTYLDIAARQEPLGPEFERVWDEHIKELYEE